MSITISTDVFCDEPGCGRWVHGDCGNKSNHCAARRAATAQGWTQRMREAQPGIVRLVDLCPEHS